LKKTQAGGGGVLGEERGRAVKARQKRRRKEEESWREATLWAVFSPRGQPSLKRK